MRAARNVVAMQCSDPALYAKGNVATCGTEMSIRWVAESEGLVLAGVWFIQQNVMPVHLLFRPKMRHFSVNLPLLTSIAVFC